MKKTYMTMEETQNRATIVAKIRGLYPIITRVAFLSQCRFADDESRQYAIAHAHDDLKSDNFGRICIADGVNMFNNDGETPTDTMLHEISHLKVSKEYDDKVFGHCAEWQDFYNILRAEWGYEIIENPTTKS